VRTRAALGALKKARKAFFNILLEEKCGGSYRIFLGSL
jgi:leucyl aminopeptidase (aminopeptidase T)